MPAGIGAGFVVATVLVDGQAIDSTIALIAIDVMRAVNRVPVALVTVQAPGSLLGETLLMAGGPFKLASQVEVSLRSTDNQDVKIFKGLVTALDVFTRGGALVLSVTIKDKAVALTGARHSKIWTDSTDSDAISNLISGASLSAGDIPSTQPTHKVLVQYESTDWDFILSRADAQGLLVVALDGSVSLKKMDPSGEATLAVKRGIDDVRDLHFEVDATTQMASLTSLAWDPNQLQPAPPSAANDLSLPQGNIAGSSVGDGLGFGAYHITHMVPLESDEAKTWASSRVARARLALIRGRVSVGGVPGIGVMDVVSLSGFGDKFNGNVLVTGVRHRVDSNGFTTDLQFGLAPEPVGRLPDIADMMSGGLLPPAAGLQVGTVIDNADPDKQGRVKVSIPAIATDQTASIWARVAAPDAGKGRGFLFMPEAGDEVIVSFLNHDPRFPVVLGKLHGAKNTLPDDFQDDKKKGIVTAKGTKIVFAEADSPSITISTPGERIITMDDKTGKIIVQDKNKNTITLDSNGITIESGKDLTLKASGNVKVSGSAIDLN